MIARVQPLVAARAVDRPFDYAIPGELAGQLERGSVVEVPFSGRDVRGVVVELVEDDPQAELKTIGSVQGRLPDELLELAEWVAAECASTLPRALALVLPPRPPKRALRPVPEVARGKPVRLSAEQDAAVSACLELLDAGGGGELLLHGVTGSGKTEVYLRVIERALALGRGAIVLVPEIALTPQTAARFQARFGPTVAVLHSGLTPARRGDEHRRLAAGEARVVVGARSAVFAAVPGLGVIVVDEEHDASYKHEADPRYDARRVAAKRARLEGAVAVFGSATPRPESWHGIRRRVTLPERVAGRLPAVEVVDLRRDGGYPLSRPLRDAPGRHRGRRGPGHPAPEPARGGRRPALPVMREGLALSALRRRPVGARPPAALPPLRPHRAGAARLPGLRLGRSDPDRAQGRQAPRRSCGAVIRAWR